MFVVYQPILTSTDAHLVEISPEDAQELVKKCESQGHIVSSSNDLAIAVMGYAKKMSEYLDLQALFSPNRS